MCGWGLLANRDGRPVERAPLQAMADAVAHRGPDSEGIVPLGPVGLAHRRLAVIDVADRSNQPMRDGDNWLLFNGAIYNFPELRGELEALGHVFHTRSDTEVLLHALDQWWIDALPRLRGMFSFAYHDARRQKMLLGRDRFGIKPLCYHLSDRVLLAGSEAKQLLATGLVDSAPDHDMLRRFLEYGQLNTGERSFFAGIKALPPGYFATYDLASREFATARWYDLAAHIEPLDMRYADARDQLRALFAEAVRSHHVANVPLGASLSGGVDSSSIAAASAGVVGDPAQFPVFTVFHADRHHDERGFAAQVARRFGYRQVEVPVSLPDYYTPEWLEVFAWAQDQPLPSGSHFNEHALFRAAHAEGVTVMLDGQGADEYFGGYGEFWLAAQREAIGAGRLGEAWRNFRGRGLSTGDGLPLVLRKYLAAGRASDRLISPLMAGMWRGAGAETYTPVAPPTRYKPLALDELTRTSIPYQLHSQDRNAMQFGIESRVPFLDHRLVEFVMRLPTRFLVGRGWQKLILRDAMDELPDAVRWRRDKIGFSSPDASFGRDYPERMAAMTDDALAVLRPLLDVSTLGDRIAASTRYDPAHFRLISLAAWVRRFAVSL
ncbi:asparagine synthase (glutamine-hydrolyzing) [Sphingopyxis sp. KK2]|uniref:asparagine synthase (glutamine-hydrolyzing) n=1 Tax=Sphingopyxis sp. KK2 TaxID=1855727 RepID=UPI00097E68A2|nr:asparagine synthase (glutamine-hydrolyzing) [Sphingopyxis sp. KK2]